MIKKILNFYLTTIIIFIIKGLDGQQIIIFGGLNALDIVPSSEALFVLNLNSMQWSIPKVSKVLKTTPNPRYYHKANVIGRYMVISFGNYTKKTLILYKLDVLILINLIYFYFYFFIFIFILNSLYI